MVRRIVFMGLPPPLPAFFSCRDEQRHYRQPIRPRQYNRAKLDQHKGGRTCPKASVPFPPCSPHPDFPLGDGTDMPRVFVVDKVHPSGLALLRQRSGIAVETLEAPTSETLLEGARAAD